MHQNVYSTIKNRLLLSLLVFTSINAGSAIADQILLQVIPAGTAVEFHVVTSISSKSSRSGQQFAFELSKPIALADRSIPVEGTTGFGTIYLAGHAGSSGHEGDLTLRLDTLTTPDDRTYTFADQRLQINGRNRKVTSGVLGLIPMVGIGARFIRGSDVSVQPTTPIETVLTRPATTVTIAHDASSQR